MDTTSFDRDWNAYKTGFSNTEKGKDGSFWLGNDHIHELTKGGAKLRVDLCTLPENTFESEELLESSEFERLEDWNITFEGAKSNMFARRIAGANTSVYSHYNIYSREQARMECQGKGYRLCLNQNQVEIPTSCNCLL